MKYKTSLTFTFALTFKEESHRCTDDEMIITKNRVHDTPLEQYLLAQVALLGQIKEVTLSKKP